MPPKAIAKSADRTGGVLPVTPSARSAAKAPAPRLKLEVRRLPPNLTLTEFEDTLGDEWKLNNGKVDWREYRQGKTRIAGSGKMPEQSRCYLHMINEASVREFEKRFLEVVFHDNAGTHKHPELKRFPPTLGFAPNQRTPLQQTKHRADNRQGTIDQDPDFIAFLEAETQPIAKAPALDVIGLEKDPERKDIKSTPLIDDLREKKANKAKAAQAKSERADKEKKLKDAKATGKVAGASSEKNEKVVQAPKDEPAVKGGAKILSKQGGAKQQQQQSQQGKAPAPAKTKKQLSEPPVLPKQQTTPPSTAATLPNGPAPRAQRQRGNADGIKKMLQKDLGIRPKAAASSEQPATPQISGPSSSPAPAPATSSASTCATASQTPTGPKAATRPKTATVAAPAANAKAPQLKAYLKHANPSQGMTEILIQQALSQYGEIAKVTIDPRKGTAIAIFKSAEALKKALDAKKIPVAKGSVEVLEFRERAATSSPGTGTRGGAKAGRGGRGGARGSTTNSTPAISQAKSPNAMSTAPSAAPSASPASPG